MRHRRPAQIKHAVNVGAERDVPFLGADILDLLEAALVRGVVNQNIEAAQLAYRALDQALAMGFVLYVTGSEHGAPARLLHPARRLTRRRNLAPIAGQAGLVETAEER